MKKMYINDRPDKKSKKAKYNGKTDDLIPVKLDEKTIVYVRPGECTDKKKLREKLKLGVYK